MADSDPGCQPSIHIPLCSNKTCQEGIYQLAAALTEKGVECVTKYNIFGTYKTWFEKHFNQCDFTIIHQCPQLWNQIKRCQADFSNEMKIMTVDFIDKKLKENGSADYDADPESPNPFHDYCPQTIADDKSRDEFVESIVTTLETRYPVYFSPTTIPEPRDSPPPLPHVPSPVPEVEEIVVEEVEDTFKPYPDIFGERQLALLVRSKVLRYTGFVPLSYATTAQCMKMGHQIDKLRKDFSLDQLMCNFKYILYEVLPSLYKNKCILGLTIVAGCNQSVLMRRAITLIELLLLENRGLEENMHFDTLITVEGLLYTTIDDLKKRLDDSDYASVLKTIRRLSNVYLMLLCEMISPNTLGSDRQKCDLHMRTIFARPFAGARRTMAFDYLYMVDSFVKDVKNLSCSAVRKFIQNFLMRGDPLKQAKDLSGKSIAFQTIIVFQKLKQVFQTFDRASMNFLEAYMQPTKRIRIFKEAQGAHMTCITMLFRSLTVFLSYGIREDTNADLQHLCEKAMDIITQATQKELPNEVQKLIQTLLCNKEPIIRKRIRKVFCDRKDDCVVSYLLQEVEKILSPVLTLDRSKQPHALKFPSQWIQASAYFNSKPALVHIVQNNEENTAGENFQDTELKILQHLQHKNIVQLFACQNTRALSFYIVENHHLNNLQTALKNRNARQAYFPKAQLYKFLVDACSAVEYCHSKEYAHRNLTAASCFLTDGNTLKLCGFHSCLPLVSTEKKAIEQNSPGIPTRWTAPESLCQDEYSTASDVWMVGHLIFEVLTHGLLPYSHVNKTDAEIVELIIKEQVNLFQEPCIDPLAYDIITQCTQKDPVLRPSVSEIKCKLESISPDYPNMDYPDLTIDPKKPSTEHGLGNPYYKASDGNDDGITYLKQGDKYLFQMKILRNFSNELLVTLRGGEFKDILPPVRVFSNSEGVQYLECTIPFHCRGSLYDIAVERLLGPSTGPYICCLYEMAVILESLNKASCILGDMCASNLFIEEINGNYKVHVISLTCLSHLKNSNRSTKLPKDIMRRTAPEVLSHNLYSPASDVFCFGVLMWEVLMAHDKDYPFFDGLYPIVDPSENVLEWEKLHKKPYCCPDGLWALIKLCVDPAYSRRPTIPHLVKELKTYCTQYFCQGNSYVPKESPSDSFTPFKMLKNGNVSSESSFSETSLVIYDDGSSVVDDGENVLYESIDTLTELTRTPVPRKESDGSYGHLYGDEDPEERYEEIIFSNPTLRNRILPTGPPTGPAPSPPSAKQESDDVREFAFSGYDDSYGFYELPIDPKPPPTRASKPPLTPGRPAPPPPIPNKKSHDNFGLSSDQHQASVQQLISSDPLQNDEDPTYQDGVTTCVENEKPELSTRVPPPVPPRPRF